jgi:hypothetical protein
VRQDVLYALSEKGAVAILVHLLKEEGAVFKNNLRNVTGSLRKVNNALDKLVATGLVLILDSSTGKKKLYRVILTEEGKLIAGNLLDIERERGTTYMFQDIHLNMLATIYQSGSDDLAKLSQVEYFDEGRKLLLELDEMGVVRLDRDHAGRPIIENPVRFKITQKGEEVAKHILGFKEVIEDKRPSHTY